MHLMKPAEAATLAEMAATEARQYARLAAETRARIAADLAADIAPLAYSAWRAAIAAGQSFEALRETEAAASRSPFAAAALCRAMAATLEAARAAIAAAQELKSTAAIRGDQANENEADRFAAHAQALAHVATR